MYTPLSTERERERNELLLCQYNTILLIYNDKLYAILIKEKKRSKLIDKNFIICLNLLLN